VVIRREVPGERSRHGDPARKGDQEPLDQGQPALVEDRLRLGHHDHAEELATDAQRTGGGQERLVASRRAELEEHGPPVLTDGAGIDDPVRQRIERRSPLAGKGIEPRVVDAVAGRQLELLRREQLQPRLARIELGQALGLAGELGVGLLPGSVLRVAAEEAQGDHRGDETRDDDADEKERWKLEAERPQHGRAPVRYAFTASREGETL
jgi:hypothetical protein